jgi:hypothetical protein
MLGAVHTAMKLAGDLVDDARPSTNLDRIAFKRECRRILSGKDGA